MVSLHASQMKTFDYFYGVSLRNPILQHSDNLNHTLQKADISGAEGQEVATMSLQTIKSLRSNPNFKLFSEATGERFLNRARHTRRSLDDFMTATQTLIFQQPQ